MVRKQTFVHVNMRLDIEDLGVGDTAIFALKYLIPSVCLRV